MIKPQAGMLLDLSFQTVGNFSVNSLKIKEEKLNINVT